MTATTHGISIEIQQLTEDIAFKTKVASDLEAKAADIDAAAYDLKAVNPNIKAKIDTRMPQEITANIKFKYLDFGSYDKPRHATMLKLDDIF